MNLVDATQKALQWALYSQHARMMRLDFPHDDAPEAILLPDSLVAIERLSEDFEYSLTLLSDDPRIPLKDLTGKMINIAVPRSDGSWRDFSGYVYSAQFLDFEGTFARYRVILIPWLKFLEKRYDNYIFHNLTLEQQTGAIFDDYPTIRSWAIKLVNSEDPVRTDTIQYMETDHHFLHRHWENMGWYYWYEHNEKGHKLHLSDWSPVAKNIDGPTNRVIYRTSTGSEMEDCISDLQPIRDMASSEFNAVNFDFKAPQPKRAGIPSVNKQGTVPKMDVYKDTGLYGWRDSKMADQLVKHRMEQLEAHAKQFVGISQNPYLQPGRVFELNNDDYRAQQHDRADYTFLITGVKHTVRNNYVENAAGATYSNEFTCSRLNVPWRPALTHRHLLSNPQTAIVVGPEGEEIHTDEYGRVRVQFHWDREGKYNQASSAWIRPSAQWAGGNFGEIAIPRIDQEVIVHFLGGNPDRPIITGRIYNEKNKTPWELPSQKSLMGIRSKEIHGKGWNNLTFDDTAGKIQAQFSTTYDLTQLNMGRITRIDGTPGLKDFRGEGFELRTDSWGVVRAGKGMYISSDIRQEADQTVMDLQEAIKQLETGLMIAEKIAQATKVAGALPADVEDQQQQLDNVYLDMKKPGVLISSPQGIALTTQKSAQMSALNNVTMTAWENIDVSAYENLRANAKRSVSLFAAEDEMKIITGKDRMRLQANKNTIDIFAKKAIKVSSISDKVDINAKSKVTAAAAGGYIELTPGGIVWGAPGLISVKCADFQVMSPDNKPVSLAAFGAQMVGEVPIVQAEVEEAVVMAAPQLITVGATAMAPAPTSSLAGSTTPSTPRPPLTETTWQRITAPLGRDVQDIIAKSPTLQRDLEELADKRWTLIVGSPETANSKADGVNRKITIAPNRLNDPAVAVRSLAHEVGHAQNPEVADYSTEQNYIAGCLLHEGAATMKNIEIQREILANGGPDIGISGKQGSNYSQIYNDFVAGTKSSEETRKAIGDLFGDGEKTWLSETQPDGTVVNRLVTYREFYGHQYQTNVKSGYVDVWKRRNNFAP